MTFDSRPGGVLVAAVTAALAADGALARGHPGFVVREGQLELARAIAQAIEDAGRLVAEAGTGTGKTFAYLVPALMAGVRVLVSTGTRNLQDQLFNRDLPEVLEALGVQADTALLKGRANYVCWHHMRRNLAEGRFARREDIADLRRIERFALVSQSGDRSALPGVPEDAPAWALATSTRENCLGQDCDDYGRCFVFRARQAAQRADVIVVNHHLFCADLALRDEGIADLLPTTEALIFDEAHQLPEVATQFFGSAVSTRRLIDFGRDLLRVGLAEARDSADWTALSRAIEQAVRELRLAGGAPGRLDAGAARARDGFIDAILGCRAALGTAAGALERAAERGREIQRVALRANELGTLLDAWLAAAGQREDGAGAPGGDASRSVPRDGDPAPAPGAGDSSARVAAESSAALEAGDSSAEPERGDRVDAPSPLVIWAEIHGAGVTLHATPLSVADAFRRHLEGRPRAWVFLSATLAVNGAFDHFAGAMGVDDARSLVWQSPFDFASQGLLYVPKGIGEPKGPDFADRVFRACWPLVRANRGRAFVLCTTLRMVDQLATRFEEAIAADAGGIGLLVQGRASRAELLERFRGQSAPLLVGSASFWEGVDVPGKQLSLVVIDKLPFAPPDEPILRARMDAARRAGEEPFRTMQLPAAAMALKQGAGRLLRSESDRGLLVVCDARLAERSYGRILLKSLPPFRRTRSQEEALAFVEAMDAAESGLPLACSD